MAEQAAHLVDRVLPHVPVRQWVLTLPYRLRYLLAWSHKLCRAVLGFYRRRARRAGVSDGRSGAVTVIQRFDRLQLNVHFHSLVLDGVFAEGGDGTLAFHPATPPICGFFDVIDLNHTHEPDERAGQFPPLDGTQPSRRCATALLPPYLASSCDPG